jgi:hypothetical protein
MSSILTFGRLGIFHLQCLECLLIRLRSLCSLSSLLLLSLSLTVDRTLETLLRLCFDLVV